MTILIVFKASLFMESSKAISVKISLTLQIIKVKAHMEAISKRINNLPTEMIAITTNLINQTIRVRTKISAIRIKDLDNLKT